MDKALLLKWLLRADLLYRERLDPAELQEMAELWLETLPRLSSQELEAGFKRWLATERFFPRPAEIKQAADTAMAEIRREEARSAPKALPVGHRTPEEIQHFREMSRGLRERIAGNRSPTQRKDDYQPASFELQ